MDDTQDLLFEIGCEELPPKSLNKMSLALLNSVKEQLLQLEINFNSAMHYASPRRMAFVIKGLSLKQSDKSSQRLGPAVSVSFDKDGIPSNAALGFAKSCGTVFENLDKVDTPKGQRLGYKVEEKGKLTQLLLPQIIEQALKKLPIPKMMRWSNHEYSFVRPVHWLLCILGNEIVEFELFGKKSSNITYGHRFEAPEAIYIKNAAEYVDSLREIGRVIIDVEERKQLIREQLKNIVSDENLKVLINEDLLDEVISIIEYPTALRCKFNQDFLRVPQESLIMAMQSHQKCFPVVDQQGDLVNYFITICNIKSKKSELVIKGNQKVMTARLSDAAFFYDSDVKIPLEEFNDRLKNVVFQKQLGSLQDKILRVSNLAQYIAKNLGVDLKLTARAAKLSKADLMSDMVFEFPELQGLMGSYYAKAQNEDEIVAKAIVEQYLPKFSGDVLPQTKVGLCLSLADKIDTLVGIFGIGQKPTGDKDPFALRRAMIGVLRILKEKDIGINLFDLFKQAKSNYEIKLSLDTIDQLYEFSQERLKGIYKDSGVDFDIFDAVNTINPESVSDFDYRVKAVICFKNKKEAKDLAQANKRVSNILAKNPLNLRSKTAENLLIENAEIKLFKALESSEQLVKDAVNRNDYALALTVLTKLSDNINDFFDNVMVISDDEQIKYNRLSLLRGLQNQFKLIADISKLAF